ncbi:UNVERIFIED_CONTAM: hypothetical protein FKN15_041212 [Acipenser sinensis]
MLSRHSRITRFCEACAVLTRRSVELRHNRFAEPAPSISSQCKVTETMLKKSCAAEALATRLGNYTSILVAYQSTLVQSLSVNHSPPLEELHLVTDHLLQLSKYNGQSLGRGLSALIAAQRQLWLSQARVPDRDKASLLDAPVTPGHTFVPAELPECVQNHKIAGSLAAQKGSSSQEANGALAS